MATSNVLRQIDAVFKQQRIIADKAKVIAVNRAAKSALAQTVMFIRKSYNIKSSDLKDEIKIRKASKGANTYRITVTHKALSLMKFGKPRQTKTGVTYSVIKGRRQQIRSAFVATVGKGMHAGVFTRVGKPRLPIKELYGPSAMQLMSMRDAQNIIQSVFVEKLKIELSRAIKYGQ